MERVVEASTRGVDEKHVEAVRAFNRYYTRVIGVLAEGLLRTPYSLTEARVVFELAQASPRELTDLRGTLDLDAGYLSRILSRFEADGLVTRERSGADARRQLVTLTRRGRRTFELLDRRAREEVRDLLSKLPDGSERRLVGAMGTIREILDGHPDAASFELRPLRAGDAGWVVQRHGVIYADEYGWDERFEALVAGIVADHIRNKDARHEDAWIADIGGEPVGCVFCVRNSDEIAQLRLLLVEPRSRGMGIGSRLVDECLRFARQAGYREVVLWTNDVLIDARRIYERAGFDLEREEPHHSFGHELVGQYWRLVL